MIYLEKLKRQQCIIPTHRQFPKRIFYTCEPKNYSHTISNQKNCQSFFVSFLSVGIIRQMILSFAAIETTKWFSWAGKPFSLLFAAEWTQCPYSQAMFASHDNLLSLFLSKNSLHDKLYHLGFNCLSLA